MPRGHRKTGFYVLGVNPQSNLAIEHYRTVPDFREWVKEHRPRPCSSRRKGAALMWQLSDGREVFILHGKTVEFQQTVEAVIYK
jgi:hypothetical protein